MAAPARVPSMQSSSVMPAAQYEEWPPSWPLETRRSTKKLPVGLFCLDAKFDSLVPTTWPCPFAGCSMRELVLVVE